MKKIIISLLSLFTGIAIGVGIMGKAGSGDKERMETISNKHLSLFLLMNQWVKTKQRGKSLPTYLSELGYKKIAIYGMSYVGETLLDELKNSEVEVRYAIDKNAEGIYADVDMFSVDDDLESVDAIVVTAITYFEEIEDVLSQKVNCPIISLEDVLYEM